MLTVRAEEASALVETLSAFTQDTWGVTPRLNLTYGVRWELTPAPAMRQPSGALPFTDPSAFAGLAGTPNVQILPTTQELWNTRYTQFAPRIGAAFRAGQSSVIRAGWGIFTTSPSAPRSTPSTAFRLIAGSSVPGHPPYRGQHAGLWASVCARFAIAFHDAMERGV